ncbi:MAG: PqqD family protein [Bacillota bacterium]
MKIKSAYVLRSIADEHIVVPTGQEGVNFNGVLTLNNSGKLLFETLQKGANTNTLVDVLMDHYDVDEKTALHDVQQFIKKLDSKAIITHE